MNQTIISHINYLGEKISGISEILIKKLYNLGLNPSSFSSKVLTIIILSVALFFATKIGNKILKIIIFILVIVFLVSVFYSMILEIIGVFF